MSTPEISVVERTSSNVIACALEAPKVGNLLLKRWFLISLLLATWLPIAFFTLVARSAGESGSLWGLKTVFLFLGTAHVPATLFFYSDKEFAAIRKSHLAKANDLLWEDWLRVAARTWLEMGVARSPIT